MSGLINLWQTNEERRDKYWLCRSLGLKPAVAARLRDWRLTALERRLSAFLYWDTNKTLPGQNLGPLPDISDPNIIEILHSHNKFTT